MYEKTSDKWEIPETEVKSLLILYNSYSYKIICGRLERLLQFFLRNLEEATEPADLYRAQGAKKLYTSFAQEMENLISDAKSEEDGTFGEGDTINVEEMMNNA